MSAVVGLLKPKHLLFADEFSQVLVYESSNFDQTGSSDDGQGELLDKAKEKSLKKILRSKDKKDQQFIDMIRIQYAHRYGIKVGLDGFDDYTSRNSQIIN